MMRIIPKKTNVSLELFKGISVLDFLVGGVGVTLAVLVLCSNLPFKLYLFTAILIIFIGLLISIDEDKNYIFLAHIIKHYARPGLAESHYAVDDKLHQDEAEQWEEEEEEEETTSKKGKGKKKAAKKAAEIPDLIAFTGVSDSMINFDSKYYCKVIEVSPMEFRFLTDSRQDYIIDRVFGAALRNISEDQSISIVKIDRPVVYDEYIATEYKKIEDLSDAYVNGGIEEDELRVRLEIIYDRISKIEELNFDDKVYDCFHYICVYDKTSSSVTETASMVMDQMVQGGMTAKMLNTKELAVFLKYTFNSDFDEREIDNLSEDEYYEWILPHKVQFTPRTIKIDDIVTHNFRIINYPTSVGNAWGSRLFNMPDTKVVMKINPIDRFKAVRNIDRSLMELHGQEGLTTKESKIIELQSHISTLQDLLVLLQADNETLFDVNIYITVYDYDESMRQLNPELAQNAAPNSIKKRIRRILSEQSLRVTDMMFRQFDMFIGAQVSAFDPLRKKGRAIHSSSVAAVFPFVYSHISDVGGINLGSSGGMPVFVDFFKRDSERVNSNMVVIGKSGSGKSFATKTILSNLAAENSRVFILDPENEYSALAKNLNGNMIDVGSATQGRINPFHIITSLSDDEKITDEESASVSFSVHLQFLEEYFKQILPGIDNDALEYLNNVIIRVYESKGIDEMTDLSKLTPDDYPIFDDLYDTLLIDFQTVKGDYSKSNLRILINYISKFATGGRNSNLWNGPSTLDVKENFTVFNFQSLLANKNNTIANAQMLLILKWLDNEIIKNRDYNMTYKANRRIIVVIDEAHVFIDPKFPIALDFMCQLAKRIRKYNGMQVIITQNIKDFVGTEEIARKSTAIINACQYSFIFPLAPNDMHDLCKLYEKAGAINEAEQDEIVTNGRGNAFVITTPTKRTSIKIVASDELVKMFE
ncbi:MAG: ATP-binding protein [Clostridiales bacterium]|nr:ATP-binding protein [Clostridiales bacterium]